MSGRLTSERSASDHSASDHSAPDHSAPDHSAPDDAAGAVPEHVQRELDELRQRLTEAQETIRAIQGGEVDALIVTDSEHPRVYTLDVADKPYRLLVEQMHQAAATLTVEGAVLHCNEPFSLLLRCPPEALHGRPLRELVDPPVRPLFDALLRDSLAASVESEVMFRRDDGSRVPVFLGVSALREGAAGVCLLVADLTDQKRRERLVADEAMARAILEQVADAVVVCDDAGKVLRASRAAHDLCGVNPILASFDRVFPLTRLGADGVAGEPVEFGAVRRGDTVRGWEVGFDRPDGRRAELLLSAGPLVAAGGETLGAVITLTDITPLREAQGELQRRATELQAADRHKDEFLAMLAHELRNPLSPIRSALEVMQLKGFDDPQVRKCRDIIDRQVQQLTRLVDDLLEVSRINSGKIQLQVERVDLTAAAQRGVETSRPGIDAKGHQLVFSAPDAPVWVSADLTRMAQVVGNLVNNAAKYTESGGRISVQVAREAGEGVIRIRDSGIGIAPEMLMRVFELFTQVDRSLDRSQGGLGIGLALVSRLVAMHGGQVTAHSAGPGRGSEFVVRLPLWQGAGAGGADPADAASVAGGAGRKVLVIDDNLDALEVLAELLGILGHTVTTASDGPSALVAAAKSVPDVVLCDIGLPLMDGYQVIAAMRARPELAATRFVALTGYGRDEDRRRSYAAGFHAHLVKPFDLDKLAAVLAPTGG